MSYADVTASLSAIKTQTSQANYATNKANASNEMNQDMFLQLMITQLQNQDPLEPMDNSEFLAQQATFTQVNSLQEMNQKLETYGEALLSINSSSLNSSTLNQAMNLVGKTVTATDPNNNNETITGTVDSVTIKEGSLTFMINGKEIGSEYITGVTTGSNSSVTTPSEEDSSLKESAKDFLSDVLKNPKLKSAAENLIDKLAGSLL